MAKKRTRKQKIKLAAEAYAKDMIETAPIKELLKSKNIEHLASFFDYCLTHPQERFFQALRNWAAENLEGGAGFIMVGRSNSHCFEHLMAGHCPFRDTFYFDDKDFKHVSKVPQDIQTGR